MCRVAHLQGNISTAKQLRRNVLFLSLSFESGRLVAGGNKRKLSVAMSIVANPKVTFLDEPSTGISALYPYTHKYRYRYTLEIEVERDRDRNR